MRCTFLGNCGLLLEHGCQSVLVDAPNGLHTSFDAVPETEQGKIIAADAPYDGLCALFFTHKHSDHYDKKRVREITQARRNVAVYATNGATPREGTVTAGPFTVRYFTIAHSGEEFRDVFHRVMLIEAGGRKLYVTGDAQWDSPAHLEIINAFSPHAAVWNPNFLSHAEGRGLMGFVKKNYLYHLPVSAEDVFGFGRKCRHDYMRYGDELSVQLIDEYPKSLEI